MEVEQHFEFKGLKTHQERVAFTHGWYAALETKVRRKTVRAKRPVQQRKGEICPECAGAGFSYGRLHGTKIKCSNCRGTGKPKLLSIK